VPYRELDEPWLVLLPVPYWELPPVAEPWPDPVLLIHPVFVPLAEDSPGLLNVRVSELADEDDVELEEWPDVLSVVPVLPGFKVSLALPETEPEGMLPAPVPLRLSEVELEELELSGVSEPEPVAPVDPGVPQLLEVELLELVESPVPPMLPLVTPVVPDVPLVASQEELVLLEL
jgi:hypothetical protein